MGIHRHHFRGGLGGAALPASRRCVSLARRRSADHARTRPRGCELGAAEARLAGRSARARLPISVVSPEPERQLELDPEARHPQHPGSRPCRVRVLLEARRFQARSHAVAGRARRARHLRSRHFRANGGGRPCCLFDSRPISGRSATSGSSRSSRPSRMSSLARTSDGSFGNTEARRAGCTGGLRSRPSCSLRSADPSAPSARSRCRHRLIPCRSSPGEPVR